MNDIIEAYKEFWTRYVDFSGRTTVKGYWMAFLCNFIISAVIGILMNVSSIFTTVDSLFALACFIPGLAIFVRRMNDCGRSWANIFWLFVPIVGWIIVIVRLCEKSV